MNFRKLKQRVREYASRPFRLDLRSLAFFRVGLAFLIILDLINRAWYLRAHYTDFGVMPRGALLETMWDKAWISLHLLSGGAFIQSVMFIIAGLFALALLVGWRTRLMTVLSWLLMISLHARNPLVLQGGDIVFRLLMFWAMFLPLGAKWSIDAALASDSDVDEQAPDRDPNDEEPGEITEGFVSMGTIALVAQISFIYVFTAILKNGDAWLKDYDAVYYALALDQFTTPVGDFLFQQQWLHEPLTIFTLVLEAVGWALVLIPVYSVFFRISAILLFVGMHMGFAVCMQLGLFSYIMSLAWLALMPGWVWERIGERLKRRGAGWAVLHSDRDTLYGKAASILRTMLFLPELQIRTAPADSVQTGFQAIAPDGTHYDGWEGVVALVSASPIFAPVGKLMGLRPVKAVGSWVAGWLARGRSGAALHATFTRRPQFIEPTIIGTLIAGGALALCTAWNVDTVAGKWRMPMEARIAAVYPRLDQRWNMFAPYPLKDDGWYVIPGKLKDGTKVDLFKNGATPIKWSKPADVSDGYPSQRWRKYMMNLWMAKFSEQRLYYGRWHCRDWNSTHSGPKTLMTFKIYFMKELTPPPGEETTVEKVKLWEHHCFDKPDDGKDDGKSANKPSQQDIADTIIKTPVFNIRD